MRCSLLLASAALLSLSLDCVAQRRRAPNVARMLQRMDADKDGKLSAEEVGAQLWRRMVRFDADDDGVLTKQELASIGSRSRSRGRESGGRRGRGGAEAAWKFLAEKYDANKDGKIEKGEYPRDPATFARLDTNGDGALTTADWSGSEERGRPKGSSRGARQAAPKVGELAPDFELASVEDEEVRIKLSSFSGDRPVALIFGSCT